MKKIGWLIALVFAALFLFVEGVGGEEKEIRKKEIKELVESQSKVLQAFFDQNQRMSQVLDKILYALEKLEKNENCKECEEVKVFRIMAKMANKDLLDVVKLINDIHGKDKEIVLKNLSEIEEKLDWVSLVHWAINNFLMTNFGPPQPVKQQPKHLLASAHFFEVGTFFRKFIFLKKISSGQFAFIFQIFDKSVAV